MEMEGAARRGRMLKGAVLQRSLRISFAVAALLVTLVSLMPKDVMPPAGGPDKLLHVVAYLSLGLLGGLGYRGMRSALLLALGLMALGGALELAQMLVPGRFASVADSLANCLGTVLGLAASRAPEFLSGGRLRK